MIPFVAPLVPRYGVAEQVSPMIRRVLAENPSKYTYLGTGTYLVGRGEVAVIDPGPALDTHFEALLAALVGERVVAIVVTHCHADHSPLARRLASATGAATYGFGRAVAYPPDPENEELPADGEADQPEADQPEAGREEALDVDFVPDVHLADGDVISGPGWTLEALHTPGHASNHLCFALAEERALFTGDHVMGWSTSVISPPDGDMTAYLRSLRRLRDRDDAVLWPTHGGPITDPAPFLAAYEQHRLEREAQLLALIADGVDQIPAMVAVLYAAVRPELHRAAARSVLAHLTAMVDGGRIRASGNRATLRGTFHPVVVPHSE